MSGLRGSVGPIVVLLRIGVTRPDRRGLPGHAGLRHRANGRASIGSACAGRHPWPGSRGMKRANLDATTVLGGHRQTRRYELSQKEFKPPWHLLRHMILTGSLFLNLEAMECQVVPSTGFLSDTTFNVRKEGHSSSPSPGHPWRQVPFPPWKTRQWLTRHAWDLTI